MWSLRGRLVFDDQEDVQEDFSRELLNERGPGCFLGVLIPGRCTFSKRNEKRFLTLASSAASVFRSGSGKTWSLGECTLAGMPKKLLGLGIRQSFVYKRHRASLAFEWPRYLSVRKK